MSNQSQRNQSIGIHHEDIDPELSSSLYDSYSVIDDENAVVDYDDDSVDKIELKQSSEVIAQMNDSPFKEKIIEPP